MTATSISMLALSAVTIFFVFTETMFIPKKDGFNYLVKENILDPKKRPFCNAFTGCGRKRSDLPPVPEVQIPRKHVLDESIAGLLELNAEPGIEDLSRQILSEAKLWEAIQEVNSALSRTQNTNNPEVRQNLLDNTLNNCDTPPCYNV